MSCIGETSDDNGPQPSQGFRCCLQSDHLQAGLRSVRNLESTMRWRKSMLCVSFPYPEKELPADDYDMRS